MPIAHLSARTIEEALTGRSRQYLVGKLNLPQALSHIDDDDLEVGISTYSEPSVEPAHRHARAKEYQYVLKGMTEYMDLDTREVHRFVAGDFYVIYPGTTYLQRIKRDTRILFFKYPGGNDKETVPCDAEALAWADTPLRVKRLDLTAGEASPEPNSLKPAVAVAVFDEQDRLLLVKRRDSGFWAMPGGTMELTESVEMCAQREVREETGVEITITGIIGTYTDPGTIIAYSDGEVRREFSIVLAASARATPLTLDEESTKAVWAELGAIETYPMVGSQRRRVVDVVAYRADGTVALR
jgi:8-oxo-dGTP diphosphatase